MERQLFNQNACQKYLLHYAEKSAPFAQHFTERYAQGLVVPVYNEEGYLEQLLSSIPRPQGKCALFVVLNSPENAPYEALKANALLKKYLLPLSAHCISLHKDNIQLFSPPPPQNTPLHYEIILIEAPGLPLKMGVGLARKIGCDLALALRIQGKITSPWIHSTDADAQLPADYFEQTRFWDKDTSVVAYTYPYRHSREGNSRHQLAMQLYEEKIAGYTHGLLQAGSPYAFHALGSIMAVKALPYAQVRGFPKRSFAEDFYLLNKLAKLGTVQMGTGTPSSSILLSNRLSERVPVGTGRNLIHLLKKEEALEELPFFYHPSIFNVLKNLLNSFSVYCENHPIQLNECMAHCGLDPALIHFLSQELQRLKAPDFSNRFSQLPSISHRKKYIFDWLDGLKTLQITHALEKHFYPPLSKIHLESLHQ